MPAPAIHQLVGRLMALLPQHPTLVAELGGLAQLASKALEEQHELEQHLFDAREQAARGAEALEWVRERRERERARKALAAEEARDATDPLQPPPDGPGRGSTPPRKDADGSAEIRGARAIPRKLAETSDRVVDRGKGTQDQVNSSSTGLSTSQGESAREGQPALAVVRSIQPALARRQDRGVRPASGRAPTAIELQAVLPGLSAAMDAAEAKITARVETERRRRALAAYVFAYWASLYSPNAAFDVRRERRIMQRLAENGDNPSELCWALDGAQGDDWLMGRDGRARKGGYTGIETLLRDRAQVERLAGATKGGRERAEHPYIAIARQQSAQETGT